MKLEGRIYKANLLVESRTVKQNSTRERFVSQLEDCLVLLCRELEIPIPLWLDKNTKEFARFHQTIFFAEQFTEKIRFDRFQIRWLD